MMRRGLSREAHDDIPAGKALTPAKHFYEQITYVLSGRGYTTFGGGKNKVEWGEGSLFAVPVNVEHRHSNSDSTHPARLLFITSFPFMLQVLSRDHRRRFPDSAGLPASRRTDRGEPGRPGYQEALRTRATSRVE